MDMRHEVSLLCPACPAGAPAEELVDMLARGYAGLELQEPAEGLLHLQRTLLVGLVASGYIHDLNNLLTLIIGGASLAADELAADHPARESLEVALKASHTAGAVARRMMAFLRRQPIAPHPVHLPALAQESLPLICRLIGQHVAVSTALGPELWPVQADPVQVEQILLNLLVNARDAMPEGGEVTITGTNVWAGAAQGVRPGDYVRLTVTDTGSGIAPEVQARLFEPFFYGDRSRGVGLGLASCRWIVDSLGGAIQVESAVGQGTAFLIFLPRAAV